MPPSSPLRISGDASTCLPSGNRRFKTAVVLVDDMEESTLGSADRKLGSAPFAGLPFSYGPPHFFPGKSATGSQDSSSSAVRLDREARQGGRRGLLQGPSLSAGYRWAAPFLNDHISYDHLPLLPNGSLKRPIGPLVRTSNYLDGALRK